LKENVQPGEKGVLGKVHKGLYERLRSEYFLQRSLRVVIVPPLYRGWFNNPKKGRFPRV